MQHKNLRFHVVSLKFGIFCGNVKMSAKKQHRIMVLVMSVLVKLMAFYNLKTTTILYTITRNTTEITLSYKITQVIQNAIPIFFPNLIGCDLQT